jgi:translocation and assembly module TamB
VVGVLPVAVGVLARSARINAWAAKQSSAALAQQGITASYTIDVKLVPLALELTDVVLPSSDGNVPALASDRISVRPRIFALLAGKLLIDQVEIDEPAIRAVVKDGELQNLPFKIPKSDGTKKAPLRVPFSVFAVTAASVDLTIDDVHFVAQDIDIDLTRDEDDAAGSSFEIAARVGQAHLRRTRSYVPPKSDHAVEVVDDDTLCGLDARVRYEPHLILVRRLSAQGSADMDAEPDTSPRCDLPPGDKRKVEMELNHLRVALSDAAPMPKVDGHVKVRLPVRLAERLARVPETDGWLGVDVEGTFAPGTPFPDIQAAGHLEGHDVKLAQFRFAEELQADLDVRENVLRGSKVAVRIGDGWATLTEVEVKPLAPGIPLTAKLDANGVAFTGLMRDLGVSPHAHVAWDIHDIHVPNFRGTILPLHIDGDLTGRTDNFVVADRAIDDPAHERLIGFHEASLATHVAIRPAALIFEGVHSQVGKSTIDGGLCSIGYDNRLTVDVPRALIDLSDITPLGDIPLAGQADAQVHVWGMLSDPHLEADTSITGFTLGDIPFGNVSAAHVTFAGTTVDLKGVKAVKGKSAYEMPQARLEFGGKASMQLDGVATSSAMQLRDFLGIWKLDDDPRFDDIDASLATRASIHLAMGGPEDSCGGGLVDVRAGVHVTAVKLYGEQFDDGDADLEFRQFDRTAAMQGADVNVRALTLHKYHPTGKEPSGSILGSGRISRGGVLHANLVMEAIPLFRVQALGALRSQVEGTVSGLATVDGNLDDFTIISDIDATPLRIRSTPLGASHLHVRATQTSPPGRSMGRTRCGGPISPPFDRDAFLSDTSSHGEVDVDGDLAAGAIHLDKFVVTRGPKPIIAGNVVFKSLDVGAVSRLFVATDQAGNEELAVPEGAPGGELEGNISGALSIARAQVGELEHARATFSPTALTIARGAEKVVMRPTTGLIALEDDRLTLPQLVLDLEAARGLKGAATVHGSITHVTADPELGLSMDLSPIDLGLLVGVVPKVERATGTLQGSLELVGHPRAPKVDGELRVGGAELQIKGIPSAISDVNVVIQAHSDEVRIAQASAKFAGGTIRVAGAAPIKQLLDGVVEAQVTARSIHLAPADGVSATADADLTVAENSLSNEGPSGRLPRVTGDVLVTQFDYVRPINLTTDLTSLASRAKRTVVDSYDPSLDAMTLELHVRARSPLRLRNNLVEAQLGVDSNAMTVSGTNQRIGLRGELKALPGGRFHLRGNDFDIRQAFIRFDDPTRIAPNVDVLAVTEYRRYTDTTAASAAGASSTGAGVTAGGVSGSVWRITLHAYGDADNLHLDMTSDPPLSQEDIVLLLTIGMTRAEVDQLQAGSLGASAALEALASVSGADKAVKQAIPIIDDFRFGSAYDPRSGRTEPQVTVGKRLTENVRASVSSGLTNDEDREVRSNLEWRLNQRLSVQGSYDNINDVSSTVGNVGVDLRWRLEFE